MGPLIADWPNIALSLASDTKQTDSISLSYNFTLDEQLLKDETSFKFPCWPLTAVLTIYAGVVWLLCRMVAFLVSLITMSSYGVFVNRAFSLGNKRNLLRKKNNLSFLLSIQKTGYLTKVTPRMEMTTRARMQRTAAITAPAPVPASEPEATRG